MPRICIEYIVRDGVNDINDAAVYIKQHMYAVLNIFMDHRSDFFRHVSSIQKEYPLPKMVKGVPS